MLRRQAERLFRKHARIVPAADEPLADIPDPDDAWIIAAAVTAGSDLLVTGDKALLALDAVAGLPILDPRAAYLKIRGLK